jgi:hypothetical protein
MVQSQLANSSEDLTSKNSKSKNELEVWLK